MSILVFDTETTGLTYHPEADPRIQPRMLELGAALLSSTTGDIIEEYEQLIDPGEIIPAEITKANGITNEMLFQMPSFPVALPGIVALFARAQTMVAHNLPFDRAVLSGELVRAGAAETFPWPKFGICTVGIYTPEWGKFPRLTELYEAKMGKPLAQLHRALSDVRALVEIIQKERLWEMMV